MPRSPARRCPPFPPLTSVEQLVRELPDPGPLPEHQLQQLLLAHLNRIPGVWLWRANTGAAAQADGRVIHFGRRGQADLLGVAEGLFLAIEVKSPGARQRPDQRDFQRRLVEHGGVYLLANDFLTTVRQVLELAARMPPRPLPL